MAFSEWKTSKTPKHGGGISIATIAIAEEQAAAQQTVQEPVKTGGEVLPDYRHLVKCQQCQHLNQDGVCTSLNTIPFIDALRVCDGFVGITLPRGHISMRATNIAERLQDYARQMVWHLAYCPTCCVQEARYCPKNYPLGNAYEAMLLGIDDAASKREELISQITNIRHKHPRG